MAISGLEKWLDLDNAKRVVGILDHTEDNINQEDCTKQKDTAKEEIGGSEYGYQWFENYLNNLKFSKTAKERSA